MQQRGPRTSTRLNELFRRLAGSFGATEAAVFSVCQPGTDREHVHLLAHVRGGAPASDQTRQAAVAAFEDIVRPCVAGGADATIEVGGSVGLLCLVRLIRDQTATVAFAFAFIIRRTDIETSEPAIQRFIDLIAARRLLHKPPIQRTGAAGIVAAVEARLWPLIGVPLSRGGSMTLASHRRVLKIALNIAGVLLICAAIVACLVGIVWLVNPLNPLWWPK